MSEHARCPFCGGEGNLFGDVRISGWWVVVCLKCGARTHSYALEADAWAAWDKRTDASEPEHQVDHGDTDMVVLLNHVLELHRNAVAITCPDDCLCWEVEGLLMQEGLKGVDESDKEPDTHLSALRGLVDEIKRSWDIPAWCIGRRCESDCPFHGECTFERLSNAIAAAEAAMEDEARTCSWSWDDDGFYETACGQSFFFDSGTPSENHFAHCPFCGVKIEVKEVEHGGD